MSAGSFRRACDVCGDDTWPFKQMVPLGDGYVCPPDARGFTDDDLSGLPSRELKPPLQPRPAEQVRETPDLELYQKSEAQIFNLLTADFRGGVPPGRIVNLTNGDGEVVPTTTANSLPERKYPNFFTLGWASEYLYQVIAEDRRPLVWIERAKAKLRVFCDLLLTRQAGSPTANYDGTSSKNVGAYFRNGTSDPVLPADSSYGLFVSEDDGRCYTSELAICGMALLRAWQVLGEQKYRAGYQAAMTCLRRLQRSDLHTPDYPTLSTAVAGPAWNSGMWPEELQEVAPVGTGAITVLTGYHVKSLVALAFIKAVKDEEGDTTYGDTTAVGQMSAATATTLSEMADAAKAFWTTGTPDAGSATSKSGFSSATPFNGFDTRRNPGGGGAVQNAGTWKYTVGNTSSNTGTIQAIDWCMALYGWYAYYGFDSKAAEIWNWFRAATSNPTFEVPATAVQQNVYKSTTGTYDPRTAISSVIQVLSGSTVLNRNTFHHNLSDAGDVDTISGVNGQSMYLVASVGLLAALWSAQDASSFTTAKRAFSKPRRLAYDGLEAHRFRWPTLMGRCGLSFQVQHKERVRAGPAARHRIHDAALAAMCGLMYRYAPRVFVTRDH